MVQNTLIVSNWKMNLDLSGAKKLISKLKKIRSKKKLKIKNIVCPQFLLIPSIQQQIKGSKIILGAQDCHQKISGSYTGDSSILLLKKFGCKYVIIGHSERRIFYNEKNSDVKLKLLHVKENGISPIVCIGESITERKKKTYKKFILKQLNECIPRNMNEIIIAYEPIWAIGTGLTPSVEDIIEIKTLCKNFLKKNKNVDSLTFLYGGSVNSENFSEIFFGSKVNGALIGGASLKESEMVKIFSSINFD